MGDTDLYEGLGLQAAKTLLSQDPTREGDVGPAESGPTESTGEGGPTAPDATDDDTTQPNIVMVTLDDVGMNDLGYLSTDLSGATPNIDMLAKRGVTLTRYYGQESCTPARATLMTGKFTYRFGFASTRGTFDEITAFSNYSIPTANKLLPEHMEALGYTSYGAGKWNLGHCNDAYLPTSRGFDSFLGFFSPGIDYYSHEPDQQNDYTWGDDTGALTDMLHMSQSSYSTVSSANYSDSIFADHVLDVMSNHDDSTPFFVWLAAHSGHDDLSFSKPDGLWTSGYSDLYEDVQSVYNLSNTRGHFAQAIMVADTVVGKVFLALNESLGTSREFVMIVNSDNGGYPCATHMRGSAYPYRGSKFNFFEGGLRVPGIVYGSGSILSKSMQGGSYNALMHHVDWVATLRAAGATSSTGDDDLDDSYDSVDHWSGITGGDAQGGDRTLAIALEEHSAVLIHNNYKFMYNVANASYFPDWETGLNGDIACGGTQYNNFIFNITSDEYETTNLYNNADYSDVISALETIQTDLLADLDSSYYSTQVKGATTSNDAANEAFWESGGFVVPWGCDYE